MAEKTVSRGVRMAPYLIHKVEQVASDKGITFNDALITAAEQYIQPENTISCLSDRVSQLEKSLVETLNVLREIATANRESRAEITRSRQFATAAWNAISMQIASSSNPAQLLEKWPQLKQQILTGVGIEGGAK